MISDQLLLMPVLHICVSSWRAHCFVLEDVWGHLLTALMHPSLMSTNIKNISLSLSFISLR